MKSPMNKAEVTMLERLERQLEIAEIGINGQKKISSSRVAVIGAGGLGSALLYCLCAGGIGNITIIDFDRVSLTDLNRQFLYTTDDIGKEKAFASANRLASLAPEITINAITEKLSADNAESLLKNHDLVVCAVDNMPSRLIANKVCVKLNIPLVEGGTNCMCGIMHIVIPHKTPCLACSYKEDTKIKAGGQFAPVVSTISSLMAQAVFNILIYGESPLENNALFYDGKTMTFEKIETHNSAACPVCKTNWANA